MLCIINEPKRIFGSALIAKKWRTVLERIEYTSFRTKATYIIKTAEKYKMYCPEIFIENSVMCIGYRDDDRYVKFYINKYIDYAIGNKNENFFFKWELESEMESISRYLHGESNE